MKVIKEPPKQKAICSQCKAEYEIEYADFKSKKCHHNPFIEKPLFECMFCNMFAVEVVRD